ncbi:MAG: hybrid sensor histidine kinase/response regulator [Methylococcaceae bacterium]|nr:MAG: hybrid sensor histidine kinase/response regulator [Methylococcaceae bacterium]
MNIPNEKPLILLVDDIPANLHVLASALKADYEIKMATSGAAALELAVLEDQPQLILLDVMMPGMDGIEVLRRLRENPRTRDIPVIFVSADASEQKQLDGLELGADGYLVKPVMTRVLLAQVRNLLRRKQAETALAQSEALFRTLAEFALVGIYRTDATGKCIYVNDRCCHIIGLGREAALNQDWSSSLHPDDRERVILEWTRATAVRLAFASEHRFLHPDGSVIWALSQAQAETDSQGTMRGYVGSIIDVTERKAADALRQAKEHAEAVSRGKSLFLSRMSHELRTPLNAILGFAQLMYDPEEPMTESQQENIDIIVNSGQQLLKMINEVLELSQLESCETHLSLEPLRLSEMLTEALNLMESLANTHGVAIHAELEDCADVSVLANHGVLKKCLLKLLSNGIKYNNDQGRLTVCCSAYDGQAYLAISDQGPGISPQQMERLFLPFERFDGDKWETEDSIGLAVTLRYIELMGGALNVSSELGVSSTFTLRLPLAEGGDA